MIYFHKSFGFKQLDSIRDWKPWLHFVSGEASHRSQVKPSYKILDYGAKKCYNKNLLVGKNL